MLIWDSLGPVAQLVARLVRNEKVRGSIPLRSTNSFSHERPVQGDVDWKGFYSRALTWNELMESPSKTATLPNEEVRP